MLVEGDVHAEVGIAGGFNCELVIVRLESLDKVVSVFLCPIIFDAEIINYETEGDVAGEMFEEAWRVGTLKVAVRLKMRDETKLAETTGLRETIHALANFEVNGVVVEEGFKVVCGDSGVGDFVAFNAYVFIAGGRKWSAKVKIFDVNREPFLPFRYSGLEEKFDHVQAGSACRHVVRYVKKVSACCASNPKLDRSVVVEFLFDHRIVIHDVAKTVAGNSRVGDRDDRAGQDEAGDFFGFRDDPMEAIRSGLGRGIGERLSMAIQIKSKCGIGFVGCVGRRERGCVGVG